MKEFSREKETKSRLKDTSQQLLFVEGYFLGIPK